MARQGNLRALARQYAQGQVSKDEYRQNRADIISSASDCDQTEPPEVTEPLGGGEGDGGRDQTARPEAGPDADRASRDDDGASKETGGTPPSSGDSRPSAPRGDEAGGGTSSSAGPPPAKGRQPPGAERTASPERGPATQPPGRKPMPAGSAAGVSWRLMLAVVGGGVIGLLIGVLLLAD